MFIVIIRIILKKTKLVESLRQNAELAAAELIQVIAMCDKFEKSQEGRHE